MVWPLLMQPPVRLRPRPRISRIAVMLIAACTSFGRAVPCAADGSTQRELLLFEDATVTAAAKHDQPTREAPSAVTVITHDEIRRFGYRTLAEVLRTVPGFYISNDRNYTFLGVRGTCSCGRC